MKADILTKPLGPQLHLQMMNALHLITRDASMTRGGVLREPVTSSAAISVGLPIERGPPSGT
ncbi:hypothetical protein GN958_ATG00546 [Phytophthora infestans]|uniref:Uncharacterized protein n=1 Tax=Phytophthora infestans TaxID=4787 RepID=A0A8S9VI56_PHYIN|nr:hypothetical protein GN958_ATG16576 [Phytophthora infestans]KAF4150338.1 hypothetical protein GN958_ATG00546 [Phytophthora infestans]